MAAGRAARRIIIGFLRAHLPHGSAGAYTPAELAALARTRRSQAAFAPYESHRPRVARCYQRAWPSTAR